MRIVSIENAVTNLPRLIAEAAEGDPFIIADAGKPLVKVEAAEMVERAPLTPEQTVKKRIGFLKDVVNVPDDFDEIGREEIERMFYGQDG